MGSISVTQFPGKIALVSSPDAVAGLLAEDVWLHYSVTHREIWGDDHDPDWSYTDEAGHLHQMVDGDYPTLEWVESEPYWCDSCQDEHLDAWQQCRLCSQRIKPGTRLTQFRVAGRGSGTLSVKGTVTAPNAVFRAFLDRYASVEGTAGRDLWVWPSGPAIRLQNVVLTSVGTLVEEIGRSTYVVPGHRDRLALSFAFTDLEFEPPIRKGTPCATT